MNPLTRWKFDRALDRAHANWQRNRHLWQELRYIEQAKALDITQPASEALFENIDKGFFGKVGP